MGKEDNTREINEKYDKKEESQNTALKAPLLLDDDDLDKVSGGMKFGKVPGQGFGA